MLDSPPSSAGRAVFPTDGTGVGAAPLWWRLRRFALVVGALYAVYQITNRWHWRTPVFLPLTALDRAIPFVEWTVWPYLVLASCVGLMAAVRGRALFLRT